MAAIEVYPAASLRAHGVDARGYKAPDGSASRARLLDALCERIDLPPPLLRDSADALDAAVCVLAAADFCGGLACPPPDPALAEREGWIWVRDPAR